MTDLSPLSSASLPTGVRSRFIDHVNGLRVHVLEAGFDHYLVKPAAFERVRQIFAEVTEKAT